MLPCVSPASRHTPPGSLFPNALCKSCREFTSVRFSTYGWCWPPIHLHWNIVVMGAKKEGRNMLNIVICPDHRHQRYLFRSPSSSQRLRPNSTG
ncbi:hypothetical protein PAXRUDRAFT_363133 [Paxillus rubicundulus Ve08.2h10]|uniref:Uncharacterized protein n=1 Tax=Paxillus rubicundulus Ve08.2h10 TaxID=930991 RepID=A0A0D0C3M9_9AGAM|nr:hypothetical protein PAXRUDRAFT_363133 [Paxillus rubicundulus Ve08.2h10]